MKTFTLFGWLLIISTAVNAQNSTITLQDLSAPASAAFILVDAAPSVIQTPGTPKAFVLGVAQSFQQSNGSFPQEYSAEFAPYWLIRPEGKSIYKLAGIKQTGKSDKDRFRNVSTGLQFSTVSLGFFNKDLIPDDIDKQIKTVAIGFHSNLLKIRGKYYSDSLHQLVDHWHSLAKNEMDENMELFTEISRHPERTEELQAQFVPSRTAGTVKDINAMISRKPVFSWDISAAYAGYGLGDTAWVSGRLGIWSSISSYMVLNPLNKKQKTNYLSIHASLRYLDDHYSRSSEGSLDRRQYFDAGGKILFDTEKFSLGFESVKRFRGDHDNTRFRTVGLISYQIGTNMYMNAAFGKNFDSPNKLIALFGINLGFGMEKVNLQ